jgi:hypothetical protein
MTSTDSMRSIPVTLSRRLAGGLPLVFGLSLVAFALPALAQTPKMLRHQFREGEQRDVRIDQNLNLSIGIGDQNLKVQMKQDIRFRNAVVSVDPNGNARIRQRVTAVKMTSEGIPGAELRFDSNDEEEPKGLAALVAPIFRAMMEGDIHLTMTPRGQILDIELPPAMLTAVERAASLPGVADLLSKESLTQMIKQSSVDFPEEGVQQGTSWSTVVETKTPSTGTQVVTTKYTYQGEENVEGRVLDKIAMTIDLQFADAPGEVQLKVTDQKSGGALYFDNSAGEMVKSSVEQLMSMDVNAGGNAIKQTLETKVNVTNKPVE